MGDTGDNERGRGGRKGLVRVEGGERGRKGKGGQLTEEGCLLIK